MIGRVALAILMLASASVAYLSATGGERYDCWSGCHKLWWLLWVEVAEERAGRGMGPAYGQALLEAAEREVAAGRADARLTDLVNQGRVARPQEPRR